MSHPLSTIPTTEPLHTGVSAFALRLEVSEVAGTGVHHSGLLDHEAILHQLADVLTRVGVADLVHLVRVQPYLSLATLEHRCSKSTSREGGRGEGGG